MITSKEIEKLKQTKEPIVHISFNRAFNKEFLIKRTEIYELITQEELEGLIQ